MATKFDQTQHLIEICNFIANQLRTELDAQGHTLTGSLAKSIHYELVMEGGAAIAIYKYLDYGRYVNAGVPANRVRYPIRVMIDYARKRGFADPVGAAFAIRAKHQREGIPTRASRRFSKNGRRQYFQDYTLQNIRTELKPIVDDTIISPLSIYFLTMLRQTSNQNP